MATTFGMRDTGRAMEVVTPYNTWTPQRSMAASYTMTGPTSGSNGVASTDFTVSLPANVAVQSSVTVTMGQSGTGTVGVFTPTSLLLSDTGRSTTFTYTPGSTGAKVISVTDDGGLTDPASITYTSS